MRRHVWRLALAAGFLAFTACVARAQRVEERWKRIAHDGFDAPVWVHHLVAATAGTAGYGAARLVDIKPVPSAAIVTVAQLGLHVRGWVMGAYTPSTDWIADTVIRSGPAWVLAACEERGRRACAVAIGAFLVAYRGAVEWAHP